MVAKSINCDGDWCDGLALTGTTLAATAESGAALSGEASGRVGRASIVRVAAEFFKPGWPELPRDSDR